MDFLTALDIGASGLTADRTRINTISMNLANAKTTRTPQGGPYRRRTVVQAATDANAEGYVSYPDINVVEEMANLMSAQRNYEANVTTVEAIKGMYNKALEIGKS